MKNILEIMIVSKLLDDSRSRLLPQVVTPSRMKIRHNNLSLIAYNVRIVSSF
jgi:hypothetical protein